MGQIRPWAQVPRDPHTTPEMHNFLTWLMESVREMQGETIPLAAPQIFQPTGYPGAVQISWSEVPGALLYSVFESTTQSESGVIVGSVPASKLGKTNSFTRVGLLDTNPRFYYVQAIAPNGKAGLVSAIASGAASKIQLVNGSSVDELVSGDHAVPLATTIRNGQIDLASADVLNTGAIVSSLCGTGSTNANVDAQFPGASVEIETTGGPIILLFIAQIEADASNSPIIFSPYRDGSSLESYTFKLAAGSQADTRVMLHVDHPSSGQHTYAVDWRVPQAGVTVSALAGSILAAIKLAG